MGMEPPVPGEDSISLGPPPDLPLSDIDYTTDNQNIHETRGHYLNMRPCQGHPWLQ